MEVGVLVEVEVGVGVLVEVAVGRSTASVFAMEVRVSTESVASSGTDVLVTVFLTGVLPGRMVEVGNGVTVSTGLTVANIGGIGTAGKL